MADSAEIRIHRDILESVTDLFEPTDFGYEMDGDTLIAIDYGPEGEEIARYKVKVTVELEKLT